MILLISKYIIFCILAIFVNLSIQRVTFYFFDHDLTFYVAILFGTCAGLLFKYYLDQRWIFYEIRKGLKQQSKNFIIYTSFSVLTTLIFWGSEAFFWFVYETEYMREIGAILGLTLGYIIKYQLDKNFVFSVLKVSK